MEAQKKAVTCGRLAREKKAKDVLVMELAGLSDITDFFLLASGTSERHVRTIAHFLQTRMKEMGIRPVAVEGYDEGRWVIIDYQSVIVHVFLEPLRELYDLESLWIEAHQYQVKSEDNRLEVGDGEETT